MSNEKDNQILKGEDIYAFLAAKKIDISICPMCLEENTTGPMPDSDISDETAFQTFYRPVNPEISKHAFACVLLACVNCGYVRSVLAGAIMIWKNENEQ